LEQTAAGFFNNEKLKVVSLSHSREGGNRTKTMAFLNIRRFSAIVGA
jgi:hypothetical protein